MNYINYAQDIEQHQRQVRYGDDDVIQAKQNYLIENIHLLTESQLDVLIFNLKGMNYNQELFDGAVREQNY